MRRLRRILGREGYGKLSKFQSARSGYSDADILEQTGVMSVRVNLTLSRLRWTRSLLFREQKEGPGSVPFLAALFGTRDDFPDAPAGHRCHQNHPPRDANSGQLTEATPPLLKAIEQDLHSVGVPDFDATESWTN